ncbi:hypothetical protein C8J57DRAFT_1284891 [Mycena rebaudengoi]|nr:hypothetical protein C8J57DRAFT_1284891 [Mycena rebaudengoi]
MDPAIPTRLHSVDEALVGKKLRLAGQVLAYDASTGLALLRERERAVVVDVALCVPGAWTAEALGTVTAVGHLEWTDTARVPALPRHFPGPLSVAADGRLVLRALLVSARADLDVDLWNTSIGS